LRQYYQLTKPGIIYGNAITAAAGFVLASKGQIDWRLFLATLVGLSLIIASACVFNNIMDRHADKMMARTRNRPLVKGTISVQNARIFAVLLGILGALTLAFLTNLLTLAIALAGFAVYLFGYTIWKYRTHYGTLIGSVAGAVPPVVGYCAVSGRIDACALIIFAMIVLWQMPHFFAIAMFRQDDYSAASIPVLPITKGSRVTKIQMLLYVVAFTVAATMLFLLGYTGYVYLAVSLLLGLAWFMLSLKGFKCDNDKIWARQMFRFSLVAVTTLCIMITID
jgi:protoheme IX farnesyltransferase